MSPLILKTVSIERPLKKAFFVALVILFVAYTYFQARNLIQGPSITLTSNPEVVQHERSLRIAGSAHNITALTLNGLPIHTDEAGTFTHTLVLENGYTIMTIAAEDRYGRVTSITRPFVYKPGPT